MRMPLTGNILRLISKRRPQNGAAPAEEKQDRQAFDRLIAEYADLERRMDKLIATAKASGIKLKGATEKALDKILYLPSGRVRSLPGSPPEMDFEVTDRTAALLNVFAVEMFDQGHEPWLDLMHDRETKIFEVRKFEYEPEGVFAYGRYTELGRQLREKGRISGVSISTPAIRWDNKSVPVCAAFPDVEIKKEDAISMERVESTAENLADMGAVLIDGTLSALQPY